MFSFQKLNDKYDFVECEYSRQRNKLITLHDFKSRVELVVPTQLSEQ